MEVKRKDNVPGALSELASEFRKAAGEPVETLHQHDASLADATTPSLEAFGAYSLGWKILGSNGAAAALPHFRRATELDKHFAMAYALLGRIYADLDESDAGDGEYPSRHGNCGNMRAIRKSFSSIQITSCS